MPDFLVPLLLALVVGSLIGLERFNSGHPAGIRTYSLVCLASTMLMWAATNASSWHAVSAGAVQLDPTRVVQGLLTGIGFLGAGVIVRDGQTIKGLTTAASIWITASLGILLGSGLYVPTMMATVAILVVLTTFRKVEKLVPRRKFVRCHITFRRELVMPENDLKEMLEKYGFTVESISYELNGGGTTFEYHLNIWSNDATAHSPLVHALAKVPRLLELRLGGGPN